MRVSRLDLSRYGRFTDASVAFKSVDGCDLHVLYGDNEAGKTTTRDALLDLFFGIEPNSRYGFIHQQGAMRIGARLEGVGGAREVARLGKTAGLLDAAGHPALDGPTPVEVAGLGRDAYRTMFSLDERTLSAGGESILEAGGELGRLLFSATAGLADFSRSLEGLRVEGEAFFKAHGRKHALAEMKRRLAELKERKDAIDVLASTYVRLTASRDAAKAAYDAAASERTRRRAALGEADRQAAALPRLYELRRLRTEASSLPTVSAAPASWRLELPDLQRREVEVATRHAATLEEVARLERAIDDTPRDEAASAAATRLAAAAERRARHATAVKDLPERRAALRAERAGIDGILGELGWDGAGGESAALPKDVVEALRGAIEGLSGIEAGVREAEGEHASALRRLDESRAGLPPGAGLGSARDALAEALAEVRSRDPGAGVRAAERHAAAKAEALERRLATLSPWRGDVAALAATSVPDATVRTGFANALETAKTEAASRACEVAGLQDEVRRIGARREALARGRALVDDAAAAAARTEREGAWAAHRAAMDAASADAFERFLRADDAVAAARLAQSDALGELRAADMSLSIVESELSLASGRAATAREALVEMEGAVAPMLQRIFGTGPGHSLASMESFAAGRLRALEARDELRDAERTLGEAREDADRLRCALLEAIEAAGATVDATDLARLVSQAGAMLDAEARRRTLAEAAEDRSRDLAERSRQLETARDRLERWQAGWCALLARTWLPADSTVGRVRVVLTGLAALAPALSRGGDLAARIVKMEADERSFSGEVEALAEMLSVDAPRAAASELLERIDRRIEAWREADAARRAKAADLADARRRLADVAPALAEAARRRKEITERLGVVCLADAAIALDAAARREELDARAAAIELELVAGCAARTAVEAEAALAELDPHEIDDRRIALSALREDQDLRTQELFAALGRTQEALDAVDGDDAAARLEEERRTVLLEIEDGALAHLALRAGIVSAEAAVRLYRERHRSTMMATASSIFRALTRGAYDGLVAQGAANGEVLVGLAAGGGSRLAREMSTATRNQLYLALRMAGYAEYAKSRPPPPFVLDDVLETFDDGRAEAALRQLAATASIGQVVYLTHHRHLCDIVRRVCPAASVQEIAPR